MFSLFDCIILINFDKFSKFFFSTKLEIKDNISQKLLSNKEVGADKEKKSPDSEAILERKCNFINAGDKFSIPNNSRENKLFIFC